MATIERPSLTQRLADEVHKQIVRHARAIEGGIGEPRSLHVEVELKRGGAIVETAFWLEHRVPMPSAAVRAEGGT